eukprot:PLAT1478.1.p1 GENE.PLAT1478.1~~PLAT1478.1.p1  ORF type:complete len:116 (+),score=31.07 PLAT1478.1:36-350(+)
MADAQEDSADKEHIAGVAAAAASNTPEAGAVMLPSASAKSDCELCDFVRGGPCKEPFVLWEECMAKGGRSAEEDCLKWIKAVRVCMEKEEHRSYYEPLLDSLSG